MNADLIGALASTLTTVAFVPQVWRAWKTRSARDLSLSMYLIFTSGVALWLLYGLLLGAMPIIVGNAVTLVLAGALAAGAYRAWQLERWFWVAAAGMVLALTLPGSFVMHPLNARQLIAFGGDGTLLAAANAVVHSGAHSPVLGVHLGHLGFLTEVRRAELL